MFLFIWDVYWFGLLDGLANKASICAGIDGVGNMKLICGTVLVE